MIVFENWINANICILTYFETVTDAEDRAIEIMDGLPFKWCRSDWNVGEFCYSEFPALGSCRVYVRFRERAVPTCQYCNDPAHCEIRSGLYCKHHYENRGT